MPFTSYSAPPARIDPNDALTWPVPAYSIAALRLVPPLPLPAPESPGSPVPSRRDRRATAATRTRVRFGGWELDLIDRQLVAPGGGTERIPGLEFALLRTFVAHARQPLSRLHLATMLTHNRETRLSGRTVDTYVSRLRRRLARAGCTDLIATLRGNGYRFDADVVRM